MRGSRGAIVGFAFGVVVVLVGLLGWTRVGDLPLGQLPWAATRTLTAQERRGETIYVAQCQSCHGGRDGGSMMDYPPRHNANGHTWHHPDCELLEVIREGGNEMTRAMREMMAPPGAPEMQAFKDKLSEPEIEAVLAYIKTLWTPDERDAQLDVTRASCPTS